ncbi:MAG: hypothetical protein LBQ24_00980 [Candidatus Peribacteria bacterium]|jgi:hypothetical protein|nr:hypothetical protein [Candidatus Peribacteria bacterium]
MSQIFSSLSKLTSIESTKSLGKTFIFNSFKCSSIIAHSIEALAVPTKDKCMFVVTFSPFVIA